MSTRAVLARPRGTNPGQFEGVYLHNAGGPAEMGPVLWALVRDRYRFDAAGFSREMIDDNLEGWSSIDALGGELAKTWDGKTKITVDQHQENFNADRPDPGPTSFKGDPRRQVPGITAPPITESSDAWGAIFAYVVGSQGLRILFAMEDGWREVGFATWGAEEPDWDALDDAAHALSDEGADDEDEDEEEDDDSPLAQALRSSTKQLEAGDLAGAQETLLAYHTEASEKSEAVLANLLYTLTQHDGLGAEGVARVLEDAMAMVEREGGEVEPALLENLVMMLTQVNRHADAVRVCEAALEKEAWFNPGTYTGYTFGALRTRDPETMRRAVARMSAIVDEDLEDLTESLATFDNMASMYVALGDRAKALEYVALCKEHGYEHFDEMPAMEDFAAIKDDPDFKALFR